jgi:citrate lyase subunit beta/citryl-CoA lyase
VADAVIADLEDAVAPNEKEAARALVTQLLAEPGAACAKAVRINGVGTPWWEDDLAGLRGLEIHAVVLPKATPDAVEALGSDGPPVIAIVETATGLRLAYETAAEPRVAALCLGAADLGAELRLEPRPDGQEILYARSKLVADSAAAGIRPPFDVVHLDTRDEAGLEAECLLARSLGMGGKMCIHPAQLAAVNRAFAPSAEQVAWAERVVAAYEEGIREGRGAVALDGVLVDHPVVERARTILSMQRRENG